MSAGDGRFTRRTARDVRHAADELEAANRFTGASAFEQAMRDMGPRKPQPLGGGISTTFLADTPAGSRSVYKPAHLENLPLIDFGGITRLRYGIPVGRGHLAAREVSAYRLDEALGFGRVPPTGLVNGPFGPGSNQQWVISGWSHPARVIRRLARIKPGVRKIRLSPSLVEEIWETCLHYPRVQRDQMAVLDYVMGNSDRHAFNFRTDRHGGIVAIDNALSFPEAPDSRFGIRSDFVSRSLHTDLCPEVLERVRSVDPEYLRAAWTDAGLSDKAITGALARLQEIADNGAIHGTAWPGPIEGSWISTGTPNLPDGWIDVLNRPEEWDEVDGWVERSRNSGHT
ncbi:hypothetical protein [Nocardia sp. NPDC002869]|uniref:hypothetical protein n=1 Tax=Nocardia sp. NPDC002869 TaxID=3161032 RepID=UPI00398D347C